MAQVCVVDDKEILRESLAAALEREDHRVTPFGDPVEALEAIRKNGFDLVLADLKMPRMDGLTLIREIRNAGCDVPIIMITSRVGDKHRARAIELGVNDYLGKPYQDAQLLDAIQRQFDEKGITLT